MESNKNNIDIYMKEVGAFELLTLDKEKELLALVRDEPDSKRGREARERLIKSNLRLVAKIAKEYQNVGLDYEDLVNEGNIGLMSAIDKFDLEKGAKLSYYASFWIKQHIRRAISNKGRTIRIPVGVVELKLKTQKFIDDYEKKNGKRPTVDIICDKLAESPEKIQKILKLELQSESINQKIKEGESAEIGDIIQTNETMLPSVLCVKHNDSTVLNNFLSKLDKRQRYIIIRRYGLDGAKPETLENIGKKFDLTRERIRQLELAALFSLREMYKKINKNKYAE